MDKLKGSITESDYSKFFEKFKDEQTDLNFRLTQLQEAENNYYITAKYVLDLTTKVFDVFKSSEVDEKRQLIKLLLSNLQLKDEKIVYDVQKPFDDIAKMFGRTQWRYIVDAFQNGEIQYGFSLNHIQTVCSSLGVL